MDQIEERLLRTFNKTFKSRETSLDISRQSYSEWDSMKHAELIIQLQKEFKLKFDIMSVLEIQNLKDFLPIVRSN